MCKGVYLLVFLARLARLALSGFAVGFNGASEPLSHDVLHFASCSAQYQPGAPLSSQCSRTRVHSARQLLSAVAAVDTLGPALTVVASSANIANIASIRVVLVFIPVRIFFVLVFIAISSSGYQSRLCA